MKPCINCHWRAAIAKNRCKACHEYRRRTGRDRPEKVVMNHARRVFEAQARG